MTKNWQDVTSETVPQYPLRVYGALSVLYNSDDEEELIVGGYASPQVVDREKHLITKQALADDLPRFLAHPHYRNAMLLHSNVQVAEVLPKWCNPRTGECWETKVDDIGLFTVVKVRTDPYRPSIVDKVIADVKAGKLASFSISADAPFESRRYECVDGTCFWIIDKIEYYEVTLCETPVNQDANFSILSKSMEDEFSASSFCQDGSCPIMTFNPTAEIDRAAYWLRKAETVIDKAPVGSMPGFRGNGVADQVKPIPAAKPKTAKDPRKPVQADTGAKAGGNAGAGANQMAKSEDENEYAESTIDSEEYYLNKSVFYDLRDVLERSLDELELGVQEFPTRMVLGTFQTHKDTILKGFSYINKTGWVAWADSLPSTLQKDHVEINGLLGELAMAARESGNGELYNAIYNVNKSIHDVRPLFGAHANKAIDSMVSRMQEQEGNFEKIGLRLNKGAVDKGFQIGWLGNAQRLITLAVNAIRDNLINHAEMRNSLDQDTLIALDVLYEDMRSLEDSLGLGAELDKYAVQGDHPELDIISEVANSTVQDVKVADMLLQRVDNSYDIPVDQEVHPQENMVISKEKVYVNSPEETPKGARTQRGPKGGLFWDSNDAHGDPGEADKHSTDGMIAWFLPPELAVQLALDGGEAPEELHVTLAYIPSIETVDPKVLYQALSKALSAFQPMEGELSGVGRFSGPEKDVCYISADIPGLNKLHMAVVEAAEAAGVQVAKNHGFTAHVTLKYLGENEPSPVHRLPSIPVTIDKIALNLSGETVAEIPLGQGVQKAIQNKTGQVAMNTVGDMWNPHHSVPVDTGKVVATESIDSNTQGAHNPVSISKNIDPPLNVVNNLPYDEANPDTEVQHRQAPDREYDNRGAVVKAGDEDARLTGLMFARLFRRAMADKRFKLAIIKNDNGTETVLDLGD